MILHDVYFLILRLFIITIILINQIVSSILMNFINLLICIFFSPLEQHRLANIKLVKV